MKTLKEYADFLYSRGYKENIAPFTFLDGALEIVEFVRYGFHVNLYVEETDEFSKYLESLEPGTEYNVEYENYVVNSAFIEAPICNVSNFHDGSTNGIELVSKPNTYNKHTLELFEQCIGFQKINLLEHEIFIMSRRQEHLAWAKENLVPLLEKYNYIITFDSFFDTKNEAPSSNQRIDFKHHNRSELSIETDCITGEPIILSDGALGEGLVDLSEKMYGKDIDNVYNVMLEEVWKKSEDKFGYIYNNDPHETVDTYYEVGKLIDCLHYGEKDNSINFDFIPERYNDMVKKYKE
jgi:hypothetical protein